MSYEGTEEYICKKGHYFAINAYQALYCDIQIMCPRCGELPKWHHSIDETNGPIENDFKTMPAPVFEVGFEDDWKVDHYGNRYAEKVILFDPDASIWKRL